VISIKVTNLMAREIVLDLIEENSDIRTAEDVADYLLKEEENETIFTTRWEESVDRNPFDRDIIEED
jgi:kynurenine formamidase